MPEYTTKSEQETEALGEALAKDLHPGDLLAFRGGLGAGKTAFIRGLARGLGVSGEVSSPTFALVHEYSGPTPLYHFDMYRVEDWQSLYSTGFFDYLDSGGILAVEWSENIENALPEETITVTIECQGGDHRRFTVEGGRFA